MSSEPTIVVDGTVLNEAQAMTVRVSLTHWTFDTEDFKALGAIGPLYRDRANEVLRMMKCFAQSAAEQHAKTVAEFTTLRPASEWHEDDGDVLWWAISDEDGQPHEAPYCGSLLESVPPFPFGFDEETGVLCDPYESCHLYWSPLPRVKAVKV